MDSYYQLIGLVRGLQLDEPGAEHSLDNHGERVLREEVICTYATAEQAFETLSSLFKAHHIYNRGAEDLRRYYAGYRIERVKMDNRVIGAVQEIGLRSKV